MTITDTVKQKKPKHNRFDEMPLLNTYVLCYISHLY